MPKKSTANHEVAVMPDADQALILRHMFDYPRLKNSDRAKFLGHISDDKVRDLIEKAVEHKWFNPHNNQVSLASLGFHVRYRVDVWIDSKNLHQGIGGLPDSDATEGSTPLKVRQ